MMEVMTPEEERRDERFLGIVFIIAMLIVLGIEGLMAAELVYCITHK